MLNVFSVSQFYDVEIKKSYTYCEEKGIEGELDEI